MWLKLDLLNKIIKISTYQDLKNNITFKKAEQLRVISDLNLKTKNCV